LIFDEKLRLLTTLNLYSQTQDKNIICPYCNEILTRYKKLKTHIEESHEGEIMLEWVIKEAIK